MFDVHKFIKIYSTLQKCEYNLKSNYVHEIVNFMKLLQ
jgi:hypothetical protein